MPKMSQVINNFQPNLRIYSVWGLALSLHGAIYSQFLGSPQFEFGIWGQTEPVLIGLHFSAALAAVSLAVTLWSTKKIGILAGSPIVLFPLVVALWSFMVGFTHDFPSLSWFGSPEQGEGFLLYLELGIFAASASIVIKFRLARYLVAVSAIVVTCIVTILTIRFIDGSGSFFVPLFFSDYLGFSGIYVVAIAATYLRGTNRLILIAGVILGLVVVIYSQNRAAWGLVFIAAPILALTGLFLSKYVSSKKLRGTAALAIVLLVFVITAGLSTIDFRGYTKMFEYAASIERIDAPQGRSSRDAYKTFNMRLHSLLGSQESRQHLHVMSLEAIKAKPETLALGQGWGLFKRHFASNLPLDWVKLRDDDPALIKNEEWLLSGHWDAVNRVDFSSHNGYVDALLSVGIIGLLLVLGITVALPLWCRKKFIILAGTVGFMSAGLQTQWFQVPQVLPLFALALGGFTAPVNFRRDFPRVKKLAPWFLLGIAFLLGTSGLVATKFISYAYYYSPNMKESISTKDGKLVCLNYFEDQGRGGDHLTHRLRAISDLVKDKIRKSKYINAETRKEMLLLGSPQAPFDNISLNIMRGAVCSSESYIDRGAALSLLISALNVRADFAFLDLPNELKPLVNKLMKTWGWRVRELVSRAPTRTDLAAPYLLFLLKTGDEARFANLSNSLFALNPDDPIALWFSGIALLSNPNKGDIGIQRMLSALEKEVERLIPVDQEMKRALILEHTPGNLEARKRFKLQPRSKKEILSIETSSGNISVKMELASLKNTIVKGLVGERAFATLRTSLPQDTSVLFLFSPVQRIALWMKETTIPLDLLFFNSNGKIIQIVRDTMPRSLNIIKSEKKAKGVLQLNAGFAKQFNVQLGDRIGPVELFKKYDRGLTKQNHDIDHLRYDPLGRNGF